jgi:hypothetical protein
VKPKENEDVAPAALFFLKLKDRLKLVFYKFKSLFKNEWAWRLFIVLQIISLIGITCLAIIDGNHLLPYYTWNDELNWDFFDSSVWTESFENWLVTAFLVVPFLMSKAIDWICISKTKTPPRDSWKNN